MTPSADNLDTWTSQAQAARDRLITAEVDIAGLVALLCAAESHDQVVVRLVKRFGALRQRDLCGLMRLPRSTISRVVIVLRQSGRLSEYPIQEAATGRPTSWLTVPEGRLPSADQRQTIAELVQDVILVLPAALPAALRTSSEMANLEIDLPVDLPGEAPSNASPENRLIHADPPWSTPAMDGTPGSPAYPAAPQSVQAPLPSSSSRTWDTSLESLRRLSSRVHWRWRQHRAKASFRTVGITGTPRHRLRRRWLLIGALLLALSLGVGFWRPTIAVLALSLQGWTVAFRSPPPTTPVVPPLTPLPTAQTLRQGRVHGTGGSGLVIRDRPNGWRIGSVADGVLVTILSGPSRTADAQNPLWWEIQQGNVRGWVSARFLELVADA
jgi:hypothetical protein